MARQILLVNGHPDSGAAHFCDAIAAAYEAGAGAAGHRVDRLDIAGLDLPYVTSGAVWKQPAPNDGIRDAQRRIASADHLVFVYPLWLGDMPAMLKSFLEQVSCDGFILSVDDRGRWRQGLKGKSARIIVTMGMPPISNPARTSVSFGTSSASALAMSSSRIGSASNWYLSK